MKAIYEDSKQGLFRIKKYPRRCIREVLQEVPKWNQIYWKRVQYSRIQFKM